MRYTLKVLGPDPGLFHSHLGEHIADLPAGKPYAVLCLLALARDPMTRDDLAAYLWPESTPERAKGSVRQALHVIRKTLGSEALSGEGGHLFLAAGALVVDLYRLDDALDRHDPADAHASWNGGPFSAFSLADAPEFNRWADQIRSQYEARLASALTAEAAQARDRGDLEASLTWLERALDVRPYDEEAHVARVDVLLDLAHLDEAEEALSRASNVVDDPTVEVLQTLRDRLRGLRHAKSLDLDLTRGSPILQFVGRTSEIAELRTHWRSVLTGRPRSVVLLGEAGVGKTRLADEFIRHSIEPDASVVRIKALDTERMLEFGIVVALVKELVALPGGAGIANASLAVFRRLIPSLGNGSEVRQDTTVSDVALADAMADLVESVSQEAPLTVLVDDLQWADPRSRILLLRVARSVRRVPVLFLSTCRSGDTDASVIRPLRAEARAGKLSIVQLEPLSELETRECIAYTIRVEPEEAGEALAARLFSLSRGNPLFLAELLTRMEEEGMIEREAGAWTCYAHRLPDDLGLPSSIREILEQRLEGLDEEGRAMVAALAHGGDAAADHLANRAGLTDAQATRAWSKLLESGLVSRTREGGATLTHDALREVARAVLPKPKTGDRSRRWRYTGWAAATMVVMVILGWSLGRRHAPARAPMPAWARGVIYARSDDAVLRLQLPRTPGGPWRVDTVARVREFPGTTVVWRGLDGATRMISGGPNALGRATARERLPDGSWRELIHHQGDVNVNDISPSGRYALLTLADETGPQWAVDLVHLRLSDGHTTHVRRLGMGFARWVPDGSAIIASIQATPDTLLVLRPDGQTLWSAPFVAGGLGARPCARGRDRVVVPRAQPGRLLQLTTLRSDGTHLDAPARAPLVTGVVCSPVGHAVAYIGLVSGTRRLVTQDLDSGDTLVGPPGLRQPISWKPVHGIPVPVAVQVEQHTLHLRWGERRTLEAAVRFSDGTVGKDTLVHWSSLDPHVAYAGENGEVFGNGEGEAEVVASVYGWLTDTARVTVSADLAPSGALLADRFSTFDTTRWKVFGAPAPAAVTLRDGPALDTRGDGIGGDGIESRRGFDLGKGGTLELEFRLPLTRRDRQVLKVCLDARPANAPGLPISDTSSPHVTNEVCFQHPVGELAAFDSTTFSFSGLVPTGRISRPDLFPSREWRHLAIVLAPDGRARLFIDRKHVADVPERVAMHPSDRWHVVVIDRAADTHLMIRDLVLWEGMRY